MLLCGRRRWDGRSGLGRGRWRRCCEGINACVTRVSCLRVFGLGAELGGVDAVNEALRLTPVGRAERVGKGEVAAVLRGN